jgi:mannose-6-phosphate isomerase-like protein (cupin superfamily)
MRTPAGSLPIKFDVPGATARQLPGFGDATAYGAISAEHFELAAGTDIAPLLEGLAGDACQAPHWGYVISGSMTVTYGDGQLERCGAGEVFHWPPGHSVRVDETAEVVMFSPQAEHTEVLDHMVAKMTATG